MTTAFARNIRALREDRGLKQYELAENLGIDRVTVNNWEMGKVKAPRQKDIINAIKVKFEVTDKDLFGYDDGYYARTRGTGMVDRRPRGARNMATSKPAAMRLSGRVHAGDAQEPDILDEMVPVPYEVAERHPEGYLLVVEGDCMDRVYPEGSLIAIDPAMTPSNGSIAVVSIDGGDYIMRRLYKGATTLVLSPDSHNEAWADIVITADQEHTVEFHGVVV